MLINLKHSRAFSESVLTFGAYALTNNFEYQETGIPFLRCVNIKDGFVSFSDCLYINNAAHELLKRSEVTPETVLLTMSGSVGNAAVALKSWPYPINSNQDIAKIRPKNVDPYYLAAFLGSRYGRQQMSRLPVGSIQQHIFIWMIEAMLVARIGAASESRISKVTRKAYDLQRKAVRGLHDAELALISALGLGDWSPPEPLTYAASATSAQAVNRFDAQFFSPRYDDMFARIAATKQAIRCGDVLSTNVRGNQPIYAEKGLPVVNSKHVRANRIDLTDQRLADPTQANVLIQEGDLLLNGTGVGTIGRAAPWLAKSNAIPDNHVTVLRADGLDPVYLSVFLNSRIGQMQVERHTKGSSGQVELYPSDIAEFMVWGADEGTQKAVRQFVLEAFAVEAQAQSLLDAAKRAVEIAIEQDEAAALRFLDAAEA